MLTTGDTLPDMELDNQDGETVRLREFRGRKLLLFAYPKAATPGCTKQACGFRDRLPEIDAAGATLVGLSPDKPAALERWRQQEGLTYDLLSDPDHKLLEALGAWGEKSMYGKKYMGIDRTTYLIDADGKVAQRWDKVKVPDHAEEVLAAVKAMKS